MDLQTDSEMVEWMVLLWDLWTDLKMVDSTGQQTDSLMVVKSADKKDDKQAVYWVGKKDSLMVEQKAKCLGSWKGSELVDAMDRLKVYLMAAKMDIQRGYQPAVC